MRRTSEIEDPTKGKVTAAFDTDGSRLTVRGKWTKAVKVTAGTFTRQLHVDTFPGGTPVDVAITLTGDFSPENVLVSVAEVVEEAKAG